MCLGKNSEWLIRDHHKGVNCWDEHSPWYRMTQLDALVFTLGLPASYIGTFDHCVEGLLYKEHPYWKQFLTKPIHSDIIMTKVKFAHILVLQVI